MIWHRHDRGSTEFAEIVESVLHSPDESHLLERVRTAATAAFA